MAQWFWRISGFSFQYPHGNSQSSIILLLGVLVFSSGFCGYQSWMDMAHNHVCRQETHTYRIKINTSLKFYMASKHQGKHRDSLLWDILLLHLHEDLSHSHQGSYSDYSERNLPSLTWNKERNSISDWSVTRNKVTDFKILSRRKDKKYRRWWQKHPRYFCQKF